MARGAPDWHKLMWPIRSTLGTNQARYIITAAAAIAGNGGTGALQITVPSGKRQVFSVITGLSPVSVIQEINIAIDSTVYWRHYFDVEGVISFTPESALMLPAGTVVDITVVNNDTSTQTMRINVAGLYEDI